MKGILVFNNVNKNGELDVTEMELPIETHAAGIMWAIDFLRKINEYSKFRRWIIQLALGKHASRELVGLGCCIRTYGYSTTLPYGLEDMDYHKDKVKL